MRSHSERMPPRSSRKIEAPRAVSPSPVVGDASPRPVPLQTSSLAIDYKRVAASSASLASLAPQAVPSAIVWITFTGSVYFNIPPTLTHLQSVLSVCKISAILLGILLVLSSANIIPKISHQILLFVTVPMYILQADFVRLASVCSHLFLYSQKVAALLSSDANVQQALSMIILLLVLYSASSRAAFGREAAFICVYGSLSYFAFTSESASSEPGSSLRTLTTSAALIFLAIHQFFDAPNAPAAYRNVFVAIVYYMTIKVSLTLQLVK